MGNSKSCRRFQNPQSRLFVANNAFEMLSYGQTRSLKVKDSLCGDALRLTLYGTSICGSKCTHRIPYTGRLPLQNGCSKKPAMIVELEIGNSMRSTFEYQQCYSSLMY